MRVSLCQDAPSERQHACTYRIHSIHRLMQGIQRLHQHPQHWVWSNGSLLIYIYIYIYIYTQRALPSLSLSFRLLLSCYCQCRARYVRIDIKLTSGSLVLCLRFEQSGQHHRNPLLNVTSHYASTSHYPECNFWQDQFARTKH